MAARRARKGTRKRFYADLLERVLWTFVQAFGATYLVDAAAVVGLDGGDKVKIALTAAGLAVLKCLGATQIGAGNTAATLPEAKDTPDQDHRSMPEGDGGEGALGLVGLVLLLGAAGVAVLILAGVVTASYIACAVVGFIGLLLLLVDRRGTGRL